MSNKEEKAKEYRLKTVLNTERYLEGGSNIEKAYIAGWDAAIDKACEWLEDNLVQCWIEDFLYVQFKHHEHQEKENVLADFRKAMEE